MVSARVVRFDLRRVRSLGAAATLSGLVMVALAFPGSASASTQAASSGTGVDTPSVTLCHATHSDTNPYVTITVNAAGAFNGHLGATGPIWDPNLKSEHISWGDIIPPFIFSGNTYSLNWNPTGIAFWNSNCNIPDQSGGGGGSPT